MVRDVGLRHVHIITLIFFSLMKSWSGRCSLYVPRFLPLWSYIPVSTSLLLCRRDLHLGFSLPTWIMELALALSFSISV
ncbi:hypothetical protein BO86DRAFT_175513 [Aspergillus japonicus CBS 114.51]|uniref:Uncharacterized protein n=1 Tax=Aspergillus japonicus CBS 114.51 TaxID=1448312 RepID=A0A8T8WS58_ASPJA|nr:hypothetical protein BO86DRAFT_175513 [Aspergillus japonicus CBS 114.51]RAH78688.1 hypothetical protein BO86DRAFT_175513 [Aspergillus japonicus CBS 114.51]